MARNAILVAVSIVCAGAAVLRGAVEPQAGHLRGHSTPQGHGQASAGFATPGAIPPAPPAPPMPPNRLSGMANQYAVPQRVESPRLYPQLLTQDFMDEKEAEEEKQVQEVLKKVRFSSTAPPPVVQSQMFRKPTAPPTAKSSARRSSRRKQAKKPGFFARLARSFRGTPRKPASRTTTPIPFSSATPEYTSKWPANATADWFQDKKCKWRENGWQSWSAKQVAVGGKSWCRADRQPEHLRPPPMVQGLYAMIGLPMPDAFVCLSTGEWNVTEMTLTVHLSRDFVWTNNPLGYAMAVQAKLDAAKYTLHFSPDLRQVKIKIGSSNKGIHGFIDKNRYALFNQFTKFPMIEANVEGRERGEMWHRPSYWKIPKVAKTKVNYYYLLKVLNSKLEDHNDNLQEALSNTAIKVKGFNGFGNFKASYMCKDKPA